MLVTTDLLSRGIDIAFLPYVINYELPRSPLDYIHRIGRTARASKEGVAITFVNEKDMFDFAQIEALIEATITKVAVPEDLGEVPVWKPVRQRRPMGSRGGGKKPGRKPSGGKK